MKLTDTAYILAFTWFCLMLLGGCGYTVDGGALDAVSTTTVGERTLPDGTVERDVTVVERATAEQPQNPDDGALAEAGKARAALMGGSQVPDAAEVQASNTRTWAGIALLIAGGLAFSLRFTSLPFAGLIPWTVCVAAMGVGAVLLMWSSLEGPLMWGSIAAVAIFAVWYFTQNTIQLNRAQAQIKKENP